jgi:hypothetical protein
VVKTTYSKLQGGGWGARVEAKDPPKPGDVLTITKKDGTRSSRVVALPIISANGVHICALEEDKPAPRGPCAECGEGKGVVLKYDSSGIAGMCCYRCARSPSEELSFA